MLKIKTKIRESNIHGTGLFADQFIPKGTITWKRDPEFDVGFPEDDVSRANELAKSYLLFYSYFDFTEEKFILCADNQKFINHSKKNLNINSTPDMDIAARDIQPGEELLCDYSLFDKEYWKRHNIDENTLTD